MGLAQFDRIDIVATDPDGNPRWIIVAGAGWDPRSEALQLVQFLIKLARHQRHAPTRAVR